MKNWQDIMVEQYGTDWANKSYGIVEVGKLATLVVKLKAENEKLAGIICEMKSLQDDLHLKHCHIKKELRDLINKVHKLTKEIKK